MNETHGTLAVAVGVFALAGATVVLSPAAGALLTVGTLTALLLARVHRPFVVGLLAFLVVQDPMQILAGGDGDLAVAIKRFDEPVVLLAGSAYLLFSRKTREAFTASGLPWATALLFAAMGLSTLVEQRPWLPSLFDAAMFSKPFMLLAIGMSLAPEPQAIDRDVKPLLIAMISVVLFGVFFLAVPALHTPYLGALGVPHERLGRFSAQGFFANPGTYSWFAAATFAVAYAAYLVYRKFTYLVVSIVAAAFVLLSLRRKSILAILAVLGVSILYRGGSGSRVRSFAIVTVFTVLALTILAPFFAGLWTQTVEEYGRGDPMATARQALYTGSAMIARDRFPLGTGWGSYGSYVSGRYYSDVYREYGLSSVWGLTSSDPAFVTDTFWPMVLGQGGVFAVFAYVTVFVFLLYASWRGCTSTGPPAHRFIGLSSLCLLTGSLIESSASHVFGASLHAALALVPAGLAWRMHVDRNRVNSQLSMPTTPGTPTTPESG